MTRTYLDRLLEAWIAGSFVAAYFAFHAPLHFDRGSAELGRITPVVIFAIPVALLVVPIIFGWRQAPALTPMVRRHVIRVATLLTSAVAVFWPWYMGIFVL